LTTITPGGKWRDKVKEIDKLGIKEIALFPTCLDYETRQKLYKMLEKTGLKRIPHVHMREEDFTNREIEYLMARWGVKVFNMHASRRSREFIKKHQKFVKYFFVENCKIKKNFEAIVKQVGGLCPDLSHWEDYGNLRKFKGYKNFGRLADKYKIGVNHISAVKTEKFCEFGECNYNSHNLTSLKQLDYVKKYKKYLADYISIELENPLKRQLEVKSYLEKILAI
jgi:hypothetical protein